MKTSENTLACSTGGAETAKAMLLEGFEHFLDRLDHPLLLELARAETQEEYFEALQAALKKPGSQAASLKVRNQIAFAKGKALALERIREAYELLDSRTVCQVLNLTRQALSKKAGLGQVLAYTDGARKYFPAFQFDCNAVVPAVGRFSRAIALDPRDTDKVNMVLGFLAQGMNFANAGDPENIQPRYQLLVDEQAFEIIVRDFENRLSMGR